MGHYDSAYENMHTSMFKKRENQAHELIDTAYQLRLDLKSFVVPDRFVENLEDLINYLNANWPKTK